MATNRASAVSPTSPAPHTFPGLKQDSIKPNPHPYAIRTTSTGLLTRSNSSGHNYAVSRHHYVPASPSPRTESRRRHKPSKSVNDGLSAGIGSPNPLPIPSDFVSNAQTHWTGAEIPVRRRAETLPNIPDIDTAGVATILADDLPSNPKLWTPSQLSTYLSTALRISSPEPSEDPQGGVVLPAQLVNDIAKFVRESKINGRTFLRLNDEDLENLGINLKWRDALSNASRVLRQNVIKGRIWGGDDSPPSGSISPSLPSHPFSSSLYNSSSSSLDLSDDTPEKPRRRHGRVRGMVASFERSGSFSSESGLEDDGVDRSGHGSVVNQWLQEKAVPEEAVVLNAVESPVEEVPPRNPINAVSGAEPSMEQLLAESDASRPWGARAWEELDVAPGVTVKRVVEPPPEYHSEPQSGDITIHASGVRPGRRSANGSSLGKSSSDRRVVTAVFAPATPDTAITTDGTPSVPSAQEQAVQTPAEAKINADAFHDEMARDALEAQLAETRALVNAFRARLEEVERKVAELERREALREAAALAQQQPLLKFSDSSRANDPPSDGPEPSTSAAELRATTPGATTVELPSSSHVGAEGHVNPRAATGGESSSLWALGASLLPSLPLPAGPSSRSASKRRQHGAPSGSTTGAANGADTDPSSIADLPQYMFLVGLGVCAVVLRVVLKKAAGKTAGVGWKS